MADSEADKRDVKSLAEVLADEDLALLFREFLHHLHSAENLAFWLEIEEFKLLERSAERRDRAEQICHKYLDSKCDAPVNVDAVLKDSVREKIESGSKISADIFDEMQDFIYGMMEFDSFRKFIASEPYKKWQVEGVKKPKKTGLFSRLIGAPRRKKSGSVGPADAPPAPVRTDSLLMLQNHIKNNKKS